MRDTTMTAPARKVLEMALSLPGCDGLPQDGWAHFLTTVGDNGGRFIFDHPDGHAITCDCPAAGVVCLSRVERWGD
jgi:hypothetical protein